MQRQSALLRRYDLEVVVRPEDIVSVDSIQAARLHEARFAHAYWSTVQSLICDRVDFIGRRPQSHDSANRLLDIGYHHVTNKVAGLFEKHDMSTAIGLFHRARSKRSSPLVYDFVELFRADIVDTEFVRFFRLKKRSVHAITPQDIRLFLSRLNQRMGKPFYLRDFHACRNYSYFMELQILRFSKSVRHNRVFLPISLPNRHEDRC